jgi:SPP1 family predicted phage head-tail adaptor
MILNDKVFVQPGELRTPVTLQSRIETADAGGFTSQSWSTIAAVMAKWTGVHGSEAWTAQTVEAERAATVLIRYLAGVDETCAVLLGSDRYEIVSIDNIQQRNEYLELKVKLARAG